MNHINTLIAVMVLFTACQQSQPENIVQRSDYLPYLQLMEEHFQVADGLGSQLQFWNQKLQYQPKSHLYQMRKATLLVQRFKQSGDIRDIHESDSILQIANDITNEGTVGVFHSLGTNAFSRHSIKEALTYLDKAWTLGEEKQTTILMMVDVYMELGQFEAAQDILNVVKNKSSFEYLIRLSRIRDQAGDLTGAIENMEKAFNRIRNNPDKEMYCWALANLGDMYGHAGEIHEAYNSYLRVLKKDPTYIRALKGIAWVAYAHDHNLTFSSEILSFLKQVSSSPDQLLWEAEFAAFTGNDARNKQMLMRFYQLASDKRYENMYNLHRSQIASELLSDYKLGIDLALKEVAERPTPQSYDLLAWNYLQMGKPQKAYEVVVNHIEGRSQEPEILYHQGAIYLANGKIKKGKHYLKMALESAFELGPVTSRRIKQLLKA